LIRRSKFTFSEFGGYTQRNCGGGLWGNKNGEWFLVLCVDIRKEMEEYSQGHQYSRVPSRGDVMKEVSA